MIRPQPKPVHVDKPRRPLRAKRWGIAYKPPRRLSLPGSDPARREWCRTQPCVVASTVPGADRCRGPIQCCHEGARKPGMGLKSPDELSFPMCSYHHLDSWGIHAGVFKGWSKERRREWADARGAEAQAQYLSAGNRRTS